MNETTDKHGAPQHALRTGLEREIEPVTVEDGVLRLDLKPFEIVTISLTRD